MFVCSLPVVEDVDVSFVDSYRALKVHVTKIISFIYNKALELNHECDQDVEDHWS